MIVHIFSNLTFQLLRDRVENIMGKVVCERLNFGFTYLSSFLPYHRPRGFERMTICLFEDEQTANRSSASYNFEEISICRGDIVASIPGYVTLSKQITSS